MKLTFYFLGITSVLACNAAEFTCLSNVSVSTLNDELCQEMNGMPGCSLRAECGTKKSGNCDEKLIYALICQDMPRMSGCAAYRSRCEAAPTCNLLPSSKTTTEQIYSICNEMAMPGCETCKVSSTSVYAECDLLGTYSFLCKAMPNMRQCGEYDSLCSNDSTLPWCGTSSTKLDPPIMRMFFHFGLSDYVLFESWVPRNGIQYFVAFVGCFLLAIFYELLQVFIAKKEIDWAKNSESKVSNSKNDDPKVYYTTSWKNIGGFSQGKSGVFIAFNRGLLRLLSTTIGYALMLIAMTFNVGLFLAVIFGFGFGSFLFVPVIQKSKESPLPNASCCGE